jgi:hypothetical protein
MPYDLKRQLTYSILSLVLSSLAAWLAGYLTEKIVGEPPDQRKLKD